MSRINILHLSDIHFKRKKIETNKTFRRDVIVKMIDSVKTHLEKNRLEPDFVVVTGDIAYSGKEYDEAKRFFEELKPVLPGKTAFLPVPGNHDVDRSKVNPLFPIYENIIEKELIDTFLENPRDIKGAVKVKFKRFRKFVEELTPGLYASKDDYYWVRDYEKHKVSFLGLNSCWASGGDNERFKIALGYPQLMKALEQAKQKNKILLMHHPLNDWLDKTDFQRCRGEIFKNCAVILHGHTHVDDGMVIKTPAASCICLEANASYTNEKNGFIGFQFVEVNFSEDGTAVKVCPYRLETRDRLRFVEDYHRWEEQDGPCFELNTFAGTAKKKTTPVLPMEIPGDYKDWVEKFHSTMDIDLLAKKGEVITVSLPEVYIPIETRNPFYKEEMGEPGKRKGDKFLLESMETPGREMETRKPSSIDIEALVGRKKRVLLRGDAGMGKTTLIKHLAYTVTHGTCPPSLKNCLPVMVFLKDLWLIYYEELQKSKKKMVFEDLLRLYLEKSKCSLSWKTVSDYLSHQRVLFLIDGLDEVPQHLRDDLVDMMAEFQFQHKENRFLFTGRGHGAAGRAMARFGDDLHDIEPLADQMVTDFITKWFRAVSGRAKGVGQVTAEGMISDIRQHEHISVFTQNPLLLTAVCILYQDGKRIPDQRADLYNRIIDNLISRRFHDPSRPGKENEILEFLMALAFETQKKNRRTIEIDDAVDILTKTSAKKEGETDARYKWIQDRFNEIEPRCGLFNRLDGDKLEFTHLTFQEFLAAKHMVYMEIDYTQFLEKKWWEETLLLYAGFLSIDLKRRSNDIVETILTGSRLLGARALCDIHESKRDEKVVSLARKRLYELIESGAVLDERFQAGVLVGGLGDTRISPDNMVLVPAGEFTRGRNEGQESAKPEQRIYLDAFMIGAYPVTNQEFKRFIDAGGYQTEAFWTPEGWQWRVEEDISLPGSWYDRKWNGANFPVVGISWYEAAAYAAWLRKETGKSYRLPAEAEWEKAARGTDGKIYPWGNKFNKNLCNSRESGLGRTSPVGIFPGGKSIFGCFDMAGNVWEWCADWYDNEYYRESPLKNPKGPAVGSNRVSRGGGWFFDAEICASAIRLYGHPAARDGSLGFRLARSS